VKELFKKLRERLPKSKTPQEIDEHYRRIEETGLEKGDLPAMLIAAFLSLGLPLLAMLGVFFGLIYLLFLR
jgi:hypothetical protein